MSKLTEITATSKYKKALELIIPGAKLYLKSQTDPVDFKSKLSIGSYVLATDEHEVAAFTLHPMINCCGICVSTSASVDNRFRGRGIGTLLNLLRIDIAREAGYSLLLCTDIESNTYQRKILKANGWSDIKSFINSRTGNNVYISVINL